MKILQNKTPDLPEGWFPIGTIVTYVDKSTGAPVWGSLIKKGIIGYTKCGNLDMCPGCLTDKECYIFDGMEGNSVCILGTPDSSWTVKEDND